METLNFENRKSFIARLSAVQVALKVPKDKGGKDKKLNYKYRSLEDILEKLKPLLKEQELGFALSDEVVEVGSKNYIKATATLFDEFGNTQTATALALEDITGYIKGAQLSGSTSSYARKNALCGLFLLDDNRDIDEMGYQAPANPNNKLSVVSAKSDKELKMLKLKREIADDLISRGVDRECLVEFFAFVGVNKDDYNSLLALNNEQIGDLNDLVVRFNRHKGGQSI